LLQAAKASSYQQSFLSIFQTAKAWFKKLGNFNITLNLTAYCTRLIIAYFTLLGYNIA
jgi:hypothetical protein